MYRYIYIHTHTHERAAPAHTCRHPPPHRRRPRPLGRPPRRRCSGGKAAPPRPARAPQRGRRGRWIACEKTRNPLRKHTTPPPPPPPFPASHALSRVRARTHTCQATVSERGVRCRSKSSLGAAGLPVVKTLAGLHELEPLEFTAMTRKQ